MLGPEEIRYQEWKSKAIKELLKLRIFKDSDIIGDNVYPKGSYLKGLDLTMWYPHKKELTKERLERSEATWESKYRLLNLEKKSNGKIIDIFRKHTPEEWNKAVIIYETEDLGDNIALYYRYKDGNSETVSVINPSKDDIDKMVELANKGGD